MDDFPRGVNYTTPAMTAEEEFLILHCLPEGDALDALRLKAEAGGAGHQHWSAELNRVGLTLLKPHALPGQEAEA